MRSQAKQNRIFRKQIKELKSGTSGSAPFPANGISVSNRGQVLVVDENSLVNFPSGVGFTSGDKITFVNVGNSSVQIITPGFGDGVTFIVKQGLQREISQGGTVTAIYIGLNRWALSGDLEETPAGP